MADQSQTGGRRWTRVALFVSLALNLAVVGVIVGHVLSDGPPDRRDRRTGDDPVIPYTRAFDDHQRRELGRSLRDSFERKRFGSGSFMADYRAALAVLRADPFDPDALQTILQAQAAQAETRRAAGQGVLTAYLASLDSEARRAYADRLEAQIEKMEERRKRWRSK
jgi:uncharacterized membrane protein